MINILMQMIDDKHIDGKTIISLVHNFIQSGGVHSTQRGKNLLVAWVQVTKIIVMANMMIIEEQI